ncbi:MAG: hypothetical protein COC24_002120 [Alphaproteobacteria bacterium]|nr:hypothetical protein [Alphaproteobacteria bacterium]
MLKVNRIYIQDGNEICKLFTEGVLSKSNKTVLKALTLKIDVAIDSRGNAWLADRILRYQSLLEIETRIEHWRNIKKYSKQIKEYKANGDKNKIEDLAALERLEANLVFEKSQYIGEIKKGVNSGRRQMFVPLLLMYLCEDHPILAKEYYEDVGLNKSFPDEVVEDMTQNHNPSSDQESVISEHLSVDDKERELFRKAIINYLSSNITSFELHFPQSPPEICDIVGSFYCRKPDVLVQKNGIEYQIGVSFNKIQLEFKAEGLSLEKTSIEQFSRTNGAYEITYFPRDKNQLEWEMTIAIKKGRQSLSGSLLDPENEIVFFARILDDMSRGSLSMKHVISKGALNLKGIGKYVVGDELPDRAIIVEQIFKNLVIELFGDETKEYFVGSGWESDE